MLRYVDDPTDSTEVRGLFYRVATVFSALWFLGASVWVVTVHPELVVGGWGIPSLHSSAGTWSIPAILGTVGVVAAACLICVLNAGLVGEAVWHLLAVRPEWRLTSRRGTAVGAVVGFVTYLTATVPFAVAAALLVAIDIELTGGTPSGSPVVELVDLIGSVVFLSGLYYPFGVLIMVAVTGGIPFLLSVAVGRTLGSRAHAVRSGTAS